MSIRTLTLRSACVATVAVFAAGCSSTAPAIPVQPLAMHVRQAARRAADGQPLLYAAQGQNVDVFSFPAGKKVGTLSGFDSSFYPDGICTDSAHHVYVTGGGGPDAVYEFDHGGTTPIATLAYQYSAHGCASDPNTGDFAVCGNHWGEDTVNGEVAVYPKGSATPAYYEAQGGAELGYCGYDGTSDLYISQTFYASLQELAKGSSELQQVPIDGKLHVWSVQRYGAAFALSSEMHGSYEYIYDAKIENDAVKILSTVTLSNPARKPSDSEFWIDGSHIAGGGNRSKGLYIWKYPAGGSPVASLGKGIWNGIAVSR
jgi:hypothetical protein